jgi:hypothetical protein
MKQTQVLTALFFLAIGGATAVQAQSDQKDRQDQPGRGDSRGRGAPPERVPPQEQQRRVQEEQQRNAQYQQHLEQQMRVQQQQTEQLQQQQRRAQYRAQQQYAEQLQEQRRQLQVSRNYNDDPYIYTPNNYQYNVNGTQRLTNQYGADALQRAVNVGYQQGVRAGQADRQDGYRSNYQNSFAYQDANVGYNGAYIDQADYNYYFREGFKRGYQDGYASQSQYGSLVNGTPSMLSSVVSSILGLVTIH